MAARAAEAIEVTSARGGGDGGGGGDNGDSLTVTKEVAAAVFFLASVLQVASPIS